MYPIYIAKPSSPQHILNRSRTIAAPVVYKGVLKMEGVSRLVLTKTFKRKFIAPNNVAVEINEPLAGIAAGGSPAADEGGIAKPVRCQARPLQSLEKWQREA